MENPACKPNTHRIVCCIGDIHGHIDKLQSLWSNLETQIDPPRFQSALIIFLGDYCDRGPNTSKVLDFLVSLPSKYPKQTHVFLCGNHDFAFAGFLGVLPEPADGSKFSDTWSGFEMNEAREGWYKEEGYERMHGQSRQWGGMKSGLTSKGFALMGSLYDAAPTFASYGFLMAHLVFLSITIIYNIFSFPHDEKGRVARAKTMEIIVCLYRSNEGSSS